jgi:hypothetical protein
MNICESSAHLEEQRHTPGAAIHLLAGVRSCQPTPAKLFMVET